MTQVSLQVKDDKIVIEVLGEDKERARKAIFYLIKEELDKLAAADGSEHKVSATTVSTTTH